MDIKELKDKCGLKPDDLIYSYGSLYNITAIDEKKKMLTLTDIYNQKSFSEYIDTFIKAIGQSTRDDSINYLN